MAHGDTLGPCEFIGSCAQNDEDGDGVNDCTDECPLTAFELLVDNSGCPIVVLEASAGPDMNATSGELVTLHGAAHVVQGQVDPASFVWNWAQTAGPAANMQQDGPDLTVDTTGVDGELTFTLDVSAAGGEASASDQANVVVVVPVVLEADAGADVDAVGGDVVTLLGSAQILQGVASSDEFVWLWEQASGPNVSFAQNGAELTLDTTGLAGELVFRLTVSIPGAEASASDEVVVAVTRPLPLRLAAGKWHNAYLDGYGHLQLWGWERYGQTGDGSLVDDLLDADAANRHTVVVTSEGQAFAFGEDAIGNSASPNLVPGAADIVQVAAMDQGAFMLTAAGQVLGVNGGVATCALAGATSRDSSGALMAVPVPGLPLGVVEITAGAAHGVAVDSNGAAWIWGSRFGCTPRVVLDHVVTAAAGDTDLALFARDDGTAWGIGFNLHGQLGTGNTTSNYNVPRQVVGLTNVVAVAAGDRHSMFLKDDGTLWTAGWNRYCQLGLEDEIAPAVHQFGFTVLLPVQVGLQDVVAVAGGETHTIAVTGDGTVWGWGQNLVGQLTDGTNTTLPGEVCMPVALSLP
jgi:alpha-tubulin suppressor-like RCC1 family protein